MAFTLQKKSKWHQRNIDDNECDESVASLGQDQLASSFWYGCGPIGHADSGTRLSYQAVESCRGRGHCISLGASGAIAVVIDASFALMPSTLSFQALLVCFVGIVVQGAGRHLRAEIRTVKGFGRGASTQSVLDALAGSNCGRGSIVAPGAFCRKATQASASARLTRRPCGVRCRSTGLCSVPRDIM